MTEIVYVCVCRAITDKQIRRAAATGVDNLHDLRDALGVGTGCGSCADMAQSILDEARPRYARPALYVPAPA